MPGAPRLSLRSLLIVINLAVLLLPVAGIQVMRLYESALVRQTESALIAQAAFVAAFYRSLVQESAPADLKAVSREIRSLSPEWRDGRWSPRPAELDLADSAVLPPFPDGLAERAPNAFASTMGARLAPVLRDAQLVTLAGIRVVDPWGVIVASTGEDVGLSVAHGEEIGRALSGETMSQLRYKTDVVQGSPLDSVSRTGSLRVFVAAPILLRDRLIGAVMLSRTPPSIVQALYAKRWLLLQAFALLVAVVVLISLLTFRLIARPVSELADRASRISSGELSSLGEAGGASMPRPQLKEVARLQEAIQGMAATLEQRASYLQDFSRHVSHEFKTPIAGIRGAIEVLQDHGDTMESEQRGRFLSNIAADADRLHRLTERLMELTRAEIRRVAGEPVALRAVLEEALGAFSGQLDFDSAGVDETLVVLGQRGLLSAVLETLLENAQQHGATRIVLRTERRQDEVLLDVEDNGSGISPSNRAQIFEAFFTTERASGGTGLGLTIAAALAKQVGGRLELLDGTARTVFRLTLPASD